MPIVKSYKNVSPPPYAARRIRINRRLGVETCRQSWFPCFLPAGKAESAGWYSLAWNDDITIVRASRRPSYGWGTPSPAELCEK